jgi:hypothetical protein
LFYYLKRMSTPYTANHNRLMNDLWISPLIAITTSKIIDTFTCHSVIEPITCVFVAIRKIYFPFAMDFAVFELSQLWLFYYLKRISTPDTAN